MNPKWEVTFCNTRELTGFLDQGWEPYAVIWVPESKFREVMQHHLKRQVEQ